MFDYKDVISKVRVKKIDKEKAKLLFKKIEDYFENCEKYGLQSREGQLDMAYSVHQAIESGDHLIIEAGVGIGKSFAYLIPLIYYYQLTGKSFIVSTSTIALQEQLEKDIKFLSVQLNIPIDIVVAKGKSNFLCINRLEDFLKKNKGYESHFKDNKQDRKDYPEIKDNLWNEVNVDICSYAKCKNCNNCEFYKRRFLMKNIQGAIICNHDLLIEDLSREIGYGRLLFKNVDVIVCDEAHNLENKVRSYKTREINTNRVKMPIKHAIDLLASKRHYEYSYNKIEQMINQLNGHIKRNIQNQLEDLKEQGIDLVDCNGLGFVFNDEIIKLSNKIKSTIRDVQDSLYVVLNEDNEELEEELNDCFKMFSTLSDGEQGNYLFWIEKKGNRHTIYYAPKNINEITYDLFFNEDHTNRIFSKSGKTFILTSATLSTDKEDYSYFTHNVGADLLDEGIIIEESQESPYDYDKNALLYCCSDIPNPKDKNEYLEMLVVKIKELIKLTNGKTMVLFTSKSDMNYVYEKIGNKIDDINIYIQNDGSSQDVVKNKFKEEINSVLFSTGIFWEGIDIKGEALSNLIIARLPFPVVDPIMEYKKSVYGEDGFKKVYIPEMLIKLKQGVGRLIRSETDKGIVCILDSRIKKYESLIKKSIPIKKFVYSMEELEKFVKKHNINK